MSQTEAALIKDGAVTADDLATTLDLSSKTLTLPNGAVSADALASTLDLSSKTVTLPSGTGGKILQVVQGSTSTNTVISAVAPTYSSTGLSASITPSATSSKVLVLVNLSFYMGSPSADHQGFSVRIGRRVGATTTNIYDSGGTGYSIYIEQNENDIHMYSRIGYNLLDSPSTTSAATYEVHCGKYTSSTSLGINPGPTANTSHITLIEVAA